MAGAGKEEDLPHQFIKKGLSHLSACLIGLHWLRRGSTQGSNRRRDRSGRFYVQPLEERWCQGKEVRRPREVVEVGRWAMRGMELQR